MFKNFLYWFSNGMKISPVICNTNFKGYDAAPLKRIYHEEEYCAPFIKEMKKIGKQEGITIQTVDDDLKWIQDSRAVIERYGESYAISNGKSGKDFFSKTKSLGLEGSIARGYLTGGNVFAGKFPDGRNWLIVGEEDSPKGNLAELNLISETYDVDFENIFVLPQQRFHLDMFIRPIGYPYVLVNDLGLVLENIEKLSADSKNSSKEICDLKNDLNKLLSSYNLAAFASCDETVKKLEEYGFIPIRIAGEYGAGINFMNAIVNKHADGKISYISNSTKCKSKLHSKLEKQFEKDLREKVPDIDKVYFVSGKDDSNKKRNYMMDTLERKKGGIHCLSLEEPDFKMWA